MLVFDAAGLALFAVSGAQKALAFGLNPVAAMLLGMLTGIGGGMVRDVLVSEIPTVLRADLYAVAALAGAAVVVIGRLLRLPTPTRSRSPARSSASGSATWPSGAAGSCRSPPVRRGDRPTGPRTRMRPSRLTCQAEPRVTTARGRSEGTGYPPSPICFMNVTRSYNRFSSTICPFVPACHRAELHVERLPGRRDVLAVRTLHRASSCP